MKIYLELFIFGIFFIINGLFAQILYQDDFEGSGNINWTPLFYSNINQQWEENLEVVANPFGTGNVGRVQDTDTSNTGAALSSGDVYDFQHIAIEADVYCYVNTGTSTSKYTGVVLMADTTLVPPDTIRNRYIKLVADFDDNGPSGPRLRLYNNDLDFTTFQYSFDIKFYAVDIPGGIPSEDGWHRMRLEARTLNADSVEYTLFFDGNLVGGGPVYDYTYDTGTKIHTPYTPGSFGLFSFQQGDVLPGYFDNVEVEALSITSINDKPRMFIEGFQLYQNFPNPFNPTTSISFDLPYGEVMQLEIYNNIGQNVRTLVNQHLNAGNHQVSWDGKNNFGMDVPAGVYYYRLIVNDYQQTRKMLLVK